MISTLLIQQWKETSRSSVFQKSIAVNIILGFFIVYFALIFILMGFFADRLLVQIYPGINPVDSFNSFLLFYFLLDLFVRFMLQDLPVLGIQPYLHLPIKKSKLIHYVLLKSVPSLFNIMILLILVPFMLTAITPAYGLGTGLSWIGSLLLLVLFNNFLLIYFKRQLSTNPKLTLFFGLVIVSLMLLDYFEIFSLRSISTVAFGYLLQQPLLIVVPAVLLALVYSINYIFLVAHTYPEEIAIKQDTNITGNDISFLNRFGQTGKLIALELKLIWRHKRSKSVIMMSTMGLFYGLIFYPQKIYMENYGFLIFVGIFMTGMAIFNYGQFIPGWQSGHFDALLTKRISPYQFYKAKFWMFVPVTLLAFLLTLPYAFFFGYKIVLINLACLLFNMGINIFVIFYFSVLNKEKLDLSKSASFNWQGVGASKFVMMLPLMLLPILLYFPFSLLGIPYWGIFTLGLVGLIGLIFHNQLLHIVARRFSVHKYKLAEGFRKG
ncbi:DUF5687 family protein [Pontibacter harenae]|uniref:DUF5687 family protein n=1 Tax=Pontibacter harenae TaxID=2894083 RepID=UPI001E5DAAF9|nr:DUF5687 family protein [Pontibacter harenae]MCC9166639.1 DUF5687 family protein [Pontibacter harenae]